MLCDGAPVVADAWANDQKNGDVAVNGIVQAVFIHSGRNTTADAKALLALLAGAEAVKGRSTGAIAFYDENACDEPDADPDPDPDPNPNPPIQNSTANPAPTKVLGSTIEQTTSTPQIPDVVLGETLEAGGSLPLTGAALVRAMVTLAVILLAAGGALRATFRRRVRSASSPG